MPEKVKPARRSVLRRAGVLLGTAATVALAVGMVAGLTGALSARAERAPVEATAAPIAVRTAPLELRRSYEVAAHYQGRVEAGRRLAIGFEPGGTVAQVLVDEGDRVAEGQMLARLDTRSLEADRAAQLAARDALDAEIELARLTENRQRALKDREFATAQRLDEARLAVARLEAERRRVEAAIAALDVALSKSEIRAPFDAIVGSREVDEGARAAPGQPVLALFEDRPPDFRVGLPEDLARGFRDGDRASVRIDGRDVAATVLRVRPDVDPVTRTVAVVFALDGARGLGEGALGTLELDREVPGAGVWVPTSALSEGQRGLWTVFLVDPVAEVPLARREAAELLYSEGDRAFVRGAFAAGDLIVLDGTHRLANGQPVAIAAGEG